MLIGISLLFSRGKEITKKKITLLKKKECGCFLLNEKTYIELYDGQIEII